MKRKTECFNCGRVCLPIPKDEKISYDDINENTELVSDCCLGDIVTDTTDTLKSK